MDELGLVLKNKMKDWDKFGPSVWTAILKIPVYQNGSLHIEPDGALIAELTPKGRYPTKYVRWLQIRPPGPGISWSWINKPPSGTVSRPVPVSRPPSHRSSSQGSSHSSTSHEYHGSSSGQLRRAVSEASLVLAKQRTPLKEFPAFTRYPQLPPTRAGEQPCDPVAGGTRAYNRTTRWHNVSKRPCRA